MRLSPPNIKTPLVDTNRMPVTNWAGWFEQVYRFINRLKPWRFSQGAQPAVETPTVAGIKVGELAVWHDTDDDKTYLVFAETLNDGTNAVRKVELT